MQLHAPRPATEEDRLRSVAALEMSKGIILLRRTGKTSVQDAARSFRSALEIWRPDVDIQESALTGYWLGQTLGKLGDQLKARNAYGEAQRSFHSSRDQAAEAVVTEHIAETYTSTGELQKAIEIYRLALAGLRQSGNSACEAEALCNLAFTEKRLGNIQEALEAYDQSLEPMSKFGRRSDRILLLYNIGQLYSDMGDSRKALQYFEQALKLGAETPDEEAAMAWALGGAGIARLNLNEIPEGIQNLHEAISLSRRSRDQKILMMNLLRLGVAEIKAGRMPEARAHLGETLRTAEKLGDKRFQVLTAANWAHLKDLENDPMGAVELFDRALTLLSTGDLRTQSLILYGRSQAERHLGRLAEALSDVGRSTEILESLRTKTLSDELRASFSPTLREHYELGVELLLTLDQRQPAAGFKAKAFEMSERAHGRAVLDELAEAQAGIRAGVSQSLLTDEQDLREKIQLEETVRQFMRMENPSSENKARLVALDQEMAELVLRRDRVEAEIRGKSPQYAALSQPQALPVKEIQQTLLDRDSLLVSYFLGEPKSSLWLVDQVGIKSYDLPSRAVIERAARDLQRKLSDGNRRGAKEEIARAAKLLGAKILGPIATELKGQRLLIVPDGSLQEIPFSILPVTSQAKERTLIDDHEIIMLPSATAISFLRRGRVGRLSPPRTVALFADPVFQRDDSRVHRPRTARGKDDGETQRISSEPHLGELPRLRSSRQEALAIAALVPPERRLVALDFDANLEKALSPELSQYRILHFATHGRLDEHPELSGIVLSRVDEQGRARNGFLHALDIYNLHLPADLVVLSACQTALDDDSRGEGVGRLTRGFLYAGAKSVVVSLWSVGDRPTAVLMARFYEGMLRRGRKPATALREAQLAVRRLPGWEAPYYWAGFVLQGDWQ